MTYACLLQVLCDDGEIQIMVGSKDDRVICELQQAPMTVVQRCSLQSKVSEIMDFIDVRTKTDNVGSSLDLMFDTFSNQQINEYNDVEELTSMAVTTTDLQEISVVSDVESDNSSEFESDDDMESMPSVQLDGSLLEKFVVNTFPADSYSTREDIDFIIAKQHKHNFVEFRNKVGKDCAFKCGICNDAVSNATLLKKHVKTKHETTQNKHPYGCKYCGKMFGVAEHLLQHMAGHELPYRCVGHCNRRFAGTCGLKRHLLKANHIFDFECEQCAARFSTKVELKSHVATKHSTTGQIQ